MSVQSLKESIDKTGAALLTLFNGVDLLVVGNIQSMYNRKGHLVMKWVLPAATHGANFDRAMITDRGRLLWTDNIDPVRADLGQKVFRLELDYA